MGQLPQVSRQYTKTQIWQKLGVVACILHASGIGAAINSSICLFFFSDQHSWKLMSVFLDWARNDSPAQSRAYCQLGQARAGQGSLCRPGDKTEGRFRAIISATGFNLSHLLQFAAASSRYRAARAGNATTERKTHTEKRDREIFALQRDSLWPRLLIAGPHAHPTTLPTISALLWLCVWTLL